MQRTGQTVVAGLAGALAALCILTSAPVQAQERAMQAAQGAPAVERSLQVSSQSRRRPPPTRLRIYRERGYLPPNAVRACNAWYEQEFRPSGTVIVPRMRCRWVAG